VALSVSRSSPLVAVLLLACACATPIGVTHVDTPSMYRSLTSSVLSADRPSPYSEQLLTRLELGERFDTDGVVYQENLGPNGAAIARAMRQFNPDSTWQKV
jgi:hypothetical protein